LSEDLAQSEKIMDLPCVVILTALECESRAVLEHIEGREADSDRFGTAYSCGVFASGESRLKIAVAECGPGNQRASQTATYAIIHYDPVAILFVGVAGGLKPDLSLGDVVASTTVYNYHSGKAAKDFLPRPVVENTSFKLEQLARATRLSDLWLNRIRRAHSEQTESPKVHIGPIAAGEQIDGDKRSNTHRLIRRYYSSALVVDIRKMKRLIGNSLRFLETRTARRD
jgi:adenosylhomocysteine nucleosidase